MEKEFIRVDKENLQNLYKILTNYPQISKEQVVNEMHKCFGEEAFRPEDVKERVKTFEDACKELGKDHPFVVAYNEIQRTTNKLVWAETMADVTAFLKLRIITAALNEGWEPKFTEDEWRYYPYYILYTKEEYNNLRQEDKDKCVLFGGDAHIGAIAGLVYAASLSAPSGTSAYFGSRLCYKSSELAKYAGKQFFEIYKDFCF